MMSLRPIGLQLLAFAFMAGAASVVAGQSNSADVRRLLSEKALFLDADLEALDRGDVVVLAQKTRNKQEIAVTGVVLMKGLPEISMETFRESLAQRSNKAKTDGGRFGEPPEISDLASFELSEKDIKDLRKCRVGNCDLNLSAAAIKRFQDEIDWNSPDHSERATALMREILLGYVRQYQTNGDKALGRLGNRKKPVDLAETHRALLVESLFIQEIAPGLYDFFESYPSGKLPDTKNAHSWSIVDFGLKPTVTLTHSVAHSFTNPNGAQRVLAAKQFYANHYLDSSLAFTFLLRVNGPEGPETYLIFSDRSRSDALDGLLGSFTRRVVTNEVLERVEDVVRSAQMKLLMGTSDDAKLPVESDAPGALARLWEWAQEPFVIIAVLVIGAVAAFRLVRLRANI